MDAEIRPAAREDLDTINDLYNHYVETSTATFATEAVSARERAQWWTEHDARWPVLVAELAGQPVGWGSLSAYAGRCGYRFTGESSVYVHPDHHRRGIGKALLLNLIEKGRANGLHSIVAVIEATGTPSVRLHEALGYREVGRLHQVGRKFERWLDVIIMQLMLEPD